METLLPWWRPYTPRGGQDGKRSWIPVTSKPAPLKRLEKSQQHQLLLMYCVCMLAYHALGGVWPEGPSAYTVTSVSFATHISLRTVETMHERVSGPLSLSFSCHEKTGKQINPQRRKVNLVPGSEGSTHCHVTIALSKQHSVYHGEGTEAGGWQGG